jgi:hypothetical protein
LATEGKFANDSFFWGNLKEQGKVTKFAKDENVVNSLFRKILMKAFHPSTLYRKSAGDEMLRKFSHFLKC